MLLYYFITFRYPKSRIFSFISYFSFAVCAAKLTNAINSTLQMIGPALEVTEDAKKGFDDVGYLEKIESDFDIIISFFKVLERTLEALRQDCKG